MIKNNDYPNLQINRAEIWLRDSKKFENSEESAFAKFYFLWSAFNALYNLFLDGPSSEKIRIRKLLKLIDNNTLTLTLLNSFEANELKKQDISDEKANILKAIGKENKNKKILPETELESIVFKIYQIRNNLTHGNKSGDDNDKKLVKNSIPILEQLIKFLIKKLEK